MEVVSIPSEGRGWRATSDVNVIILMEAILFFNTLPHSLAFLLQFVHVPAPPKGHGPGRVH